MAKRPSLIRQIQERLTNQLRVGESKHHVKIQENTHAPSGIFSYSTLKTYIKHSCNFSNWVRSKYGIKFIDDGKQYVNEYIQIRIDKGLSAWTVKLDINALAKLYNCRVKDFEVYTPSRNRIDIKRSRKKCNHDKHFSEKKNQSIVDFARATGLRRHEMIELKPHNLIKNDRGLFVHVLNGKGGKKRLAPVRKGFENIVIERFEKYRTMGFVFASGEIKNRMDVHSYRGEYAKALYNQFARPIHTLSREEKYFCRRDRVGDVFDRKAMLEVSRALGHNRIDVIASNYL